MESHDQERFGCMVKHKLSSGDQKEKVFHNDDLSCQRDEMSQNSTLKMPFEDKQTGDGWEEKL